MSNGEADERRVTFLRAKGLTEAEIEVGWCGARAFAVFFPSRIAHHSSSSSFVHLPSPIGIFQIVHFFFFFEASRSH